MLDVTVYTMITGYKKSERMLWGGHRLIREQHFPHVEFLHQNIQAVEETRPGCLIVCD